MARGGRLPRTAGRPPRFLTTGHRRATSLSEAHLQAAQSDAGHTLGREAEGVLQSLLFHRASRGLRAQRATFRVLAEGDPDVDAALASAVSCSPPPRSLTPPRPPLSDQRGRAARLRALPRLSGSRSFANAGKWSAPGYAQRRIAGAMASSGLCGVGWSRGGWWVIHGDGGAHSHSASRKARSRSGALYVTGLSVGSWRRLRAASFMARSASR